MDISLIVSLISLVGVILGYAVWLPQQKAKIKEELQSEYQKKLNEKKWEIYSNFLFYTNNILKEILEHYEKPSKPRIELIAHLEKSFAKDIPKLLIIASDNVIKALRDWRVAYHTNGLLDQFTLVKYFEFIIATRNDLGNKTTDLSMDDMLGSILPNYQRAL